MIYLILFIVSLFSLFFNLDIEDPDIMESRNFVTAREMVRDGHWMIPTMNGKIRIEKPPLPTWLTAAAYKMSGEENNAILRIPAAILTMAMIFLFFGLIFTLSRDRSIAFISALVLSTSFLIMRMGRTGTWDIYTNVFMIGALFFLIKSKERAIYCWLAGLFFGFSIMSKGPVSIFVMFIPFCISYIMIYKDEIKKTNFKKTFIFIFSAAVSGGLWYVYIYGIHSEAALTVAKVESNSWFSKHVQPLWYYFNFPVFSGVWAVLGITALIKGKVEKTVENIKLYRFILLWTLITLILLSLMPEKKERYLLPVIIPMAALIGQYIADVYRKIKKGTESRFAIFSINIHAYVMSVISIAVPIVVITNIKEYGGKIIFITTISLVYILFSFLFLYLCKKQNVKGIFVMTVLFMLFSNVAVTRFYAETFMKRESKDLRNLTEIKKMNIVHNMHFFTIGDIGISEIWSIGDKVNTIDLSAKEKLEYPLVVFCREENAEGVRSQFKDKYDITKEYLFYENSVSKRKIYCFVIDKKILKITCIYRKYIKIRCI